jgi:hypothetical protein
MKNKDKHKPKRTRNVVTSNVEECDGFKITKLDGVIHVEIN